MRLGLLALGIGSGARRDVIDAVASAVEHVAKTRACCEQRGCDVAELRLAVALRDPQRSDVAELADRWLPEVGPQP